jgi:hypothetical protein
MPDNKKVILKNYKPNLIPEAIEVTMRELNLTREEAIKFMTETSYQLRYAKKKPKAV